MKDEKISFSLTSQEVHELEAIRYRYLFSDKFFPYVPDFKDLIQGMVLLTRITIAGNRNSLRSFINSVAHRRELPEITPEELGEKEEESKIVKDHEDIDSEYFTEEMSSKKARTRSYIFSTEKDDRENIDRIKRLISPKLRIPVENIRDSEILKASVGFIIRHKWRNIDYFHYTYFGALYDIKPITILKMLPTKEDIDMNEEEIIEIGEIEADRENINKFIRKLKKTRPPQTAEELYQFVKNGQRSEFAGFNYAEAFLGYWLMSRILPYNLTVYSFSVVSSGLSLVDSNETEDGGERWENAKDKFSLILSSTLEAVIMGNKEKIGNRA